MEPPEKPIEAHGKQAASWFNLPSSSIEVDSKTDSKAEILLRNVAISYGQNRSYLSIK